MTDDVRSINCNFANEGLLYHAYMPYITGGGLFIRTKSVYELGDEIHLNVKLLDEVDHYELTGQVVWITPNGEQGNKPAGIGIQLTSDNSRVFCNKVETYLAGMLKSTQITDTL